MLHNCRQKVKFVIFYNIILIKRKIESVEIYNKNYVYYVYRSE